MGFQLPSRQREYDEQVALERKETERQNREILMRLSDKIAMMVSNKIQNELIRPGPVAEERECYEMAQELQDLRPGLSELIAAILKEEGVKP